MEINRAARIECLAALSASPEQRHLNASQYIAQYLEQVRTPLFLMDHTAVIPFHSDEYDLEERKEGLAEYFFLDPPPPSQWIWGRTILAEIASLQLIQAVLQHPLEASGMYLSLVPTSIDKSSLKDEIPPKKGVDHCILQIQETAEGQALLPICGIDVTVGNSALVKSKRKRPPLQCDIAMPAIVVPLMNLTWDGKKSRPFNEYVDKHVREQVLRTGAYSPFHGLDEQDIGIWKLIIRNELEVALDRCGKGLRTNGHPYLTEYPHMDEVHQKLDITAQLVARSSAAMHC